MCGRSGSMVTMVKPVPGESLGGDSAGPLRNAPNVMGEADSDIAIVSYHEQVHQRLTFHSVTSEAALPPNGGRPTSS